jgi:hypothetical protein
VFVVVLAEGVDMFRQSGRCYLWDVHPIRRFILSDGWMWVWWLNPEIFVAFWLTAFATGDGIILAENLRACGRFVTLLNYTMLFALQLRKSKENLSEISRIVLILIMTSLVPYYWKHRLACTASVVLG